MSEVQSVFTPSANSLCVAFDDEMGPMYLMETTGMLLVNVVITITCTYFVLQKLVSAGPMVMKQVTSMLC